VTPGKVRRPKMTTGSQPSPTQVQALQHVDPQATGRLRHLLFGAEILQAISVVASLGVPDLLAAGPRSYTELAEATGTHAQSLLRVLRVLAAEGVLTQDENDCFGLTPVGNLLRTGVTGSQRASAIMKGSPYEWAAWGAFRRSVDDGGAAFRHAHGIGLFQYLDGHPDAAEVFNDMMTGITGAKCGAILGSYDFSWAGTYADVGGGHGILMARVLAAHPGMKGILFDLPSVADAAREQLDSAGVSDRCQFVGGSFLESVPPGADLYSLVSVLLNWTDQDAQRILHACHAAMRGNGRLLVVDWLVPPGGEPHPSKYVDLQMLALFGGRQRTEQEHRVLLSESGFEVTRVTETRSGFSLIEAVPR
jgi:hypothetical protein